jgi:hypothetical protein
MPPHLREEARQALDAAGGAAMDDAFKHLGRRIARQRTVFQAESFRELRRPLSKKSNAKNKINLMVAKKPIL